MLDKDKAKALLDDPTRRKFLAATGSMSAVLGIAGGELGGDDSGSLTGGTMALEQAYKVAEADRTIYVGPDSARQDITPDDGDRYDAVDTQVSYYGDGGGWNRMGIGSKEQPVPAVHTEVSRTKSEPVHNVKAYGAVGDGATDDTQPVLDAITAANNNGGTVFIPPGEYYIPTLVTGTYSDSDYLTNISNIDIVGSGWDSVLTVNDGDGDALFFDGATGVHVADLQIVGGGTSASEQSGMGFMSSSENCSARHVKVRDFSYDGLQAFQDLSQNISFINCWVDNVGDDGINPGGPGNAAVYGGKIIGCATTNCGSVGIHVSNDNQGTIIANNVSIGCGTGIDILKNRGISVVGNVVRDSDDNGIEIQSAGDQYDFHFGHIISNNLIYGSGANGIVIDGGNKISVANNTVIESTNTGITVDSVPRVSITSNSVESGISVASSSRDDIWSAISSNTITSGNLSVDGTHIAMMGNIIESGDISESGVADYNTLVGNIAQNISTIGTNNQEVANISTSA